MLLINLHVTECFKTRLFIIAFTAFLATRQLTQTLFSFFSLFESHSSIIVSGCWQGFYVRQLGIDPLKFFMCSFFLHHFSVRLESDLLVCDSWHFFVHFYTGEKIVTNRLLSSPAASALGRSPVALRLSTPERNGGPVSVTPSTPKVRL